MTSRRIGLGFALALTLFFTPRPDASCAQEEPRLPEAKLSLQEIPEAEPPDKTPPVEAAAPDCPCADVPFDWKNNPPVRIFPRLGFFFVPPTGDGYYSLLDVCKGTCRKAPPKTPYGAISPIAYSFFDADFRYLDQPGNTQHDYADCLHRIHVGDNWLVSTGGEIRWRHNHEINSRLTGVTNDYDLTRVRIFGDVWYRNRLRLFVEFLDAQSFNGALPPLANERDFGDLLNAFVDVKVFGDDKYPGYVRVGRQELLLGSERLISPLDWVNTRRTFQGARAFRQGEKFDVDLFWVQPVLPSANRFDSVDNNQNFAGLWTTYRPQKGQFADLYYLFLDNTNKSDPAKTTGLVLTPSSIHTIGTRYAGDKQNFLWDFEGMAQFGERGQQEILAGSGTAGLGYHFAKRPLNPIFWAYFDYATGDFSPNAGSRFGTFNQLFAFGHYYMGWNDQVGRQNIQDFNLHLYLYPTKWITVWTQYHRFWLASDVDALYGISGSPVRRDPSGAAGRDVGQELDLFVNFHLSQHSDLLFGWTKIYAGNFLQQTGTTAASHRSPETFFLQYSYRW